MLRPGGRHTRRSVRHCCLLTSVLGAILLLVSVVSRPLHRALTSDPLQDRLSTVSKQSSLKALPWKQPMPMMESASFQSSPYNADNRRQLSASSEPTAGPKVISWQASRTLRVTSASSRMFQGCPVSACQVSPSAKSLPAAQAVVFDEGRMNKQTPPPLSDRRVLVYYDMRTPNEAYFKAKGQLFSPYWRSAINWVWSYRLNSDIFEPFAYLQPMPVTVAMKKAVDAAARRKSRLAVWVDPRVRRQEEGQEDLDKNLHKGKSQTGVEDFTGELRTLVSMDTMDAISLQTALRNPGEDFLLSKYFFLLALEWVSCPDYVSDLFFFAFDPRVMVIPVVRGAVNYTRHFPKDSFVDAGLFPTPRALARHLKELAADPRAYRRMLLAKRRHVREGGVGHAWCQLCDLLHRLPREQALQQRYEDIHAWRHHHGTCRVTNSSEADQPALSQGFME